MRRIDRVLICRYWKALTHVMAAGIAYLAISIPTQAVSQKASPALSWTFRRDNRILVEIPARDLRGRKFDRMPAHLKIDRTVDPSSFVIVRYDPSTNLPLPETIEFRFDSGQSTLFMSHYWPDNGKNGGTLVWKHEQHGNRSSFYAIYFDSWRPNAGVAQRDWIGDGDVEYVPHAPFPGVLMARPAGTDWDGDGKADVIVGDELGYVTLYRNIGTASNPRFGLGEPLLADGKPVKVDWCAAPFVVDWNHDGLPDLLVAEEPQGKIRYYQNIGTRQHPLLTDRGWIQADGDVLKPPYLPVPEMPPGIFKDRYGSIPAAVDWDGDGKLDLLVGTYITGEIYLYRNVGQNADGTPKLHFVGPLQADGKDLDVIWNSTPSTADLNHDGKLELVSGSFGMSMTGGDRPGLSRLHLFERSGQSLHELPFPFDEDEKVVMKKLASSGGAPFSTALVDLNSDGLIDLLVGTASGEVAYLQNVGTSTKPLFHYTGSLEGDWIPRHWSFDSLVNFDGTGKPALLEGGFGTRVTVTRDAPKFEHPMELKTVSGMSMGKIAEHGDEFGNAQFYDVDGDGKPDIVFGTVDGRVLFYRNIGTREKPQFSDAEEATMRDGTPLVAGMSADAKVKDFTVLQGNRAIPAIADFNGDGKMDLVVGNAIGQVLYFENVGDNQHPRFSSPKVLMTRPGRVYLTTTDWNGDGLPDLILASGTDSSGNQLVLLQHIADRTKAEFEKPVYIRMPTQVPYPIPASLDWDGDGDQDFLIGSSYEFVYLLDGSFIRNGYAEARFLKFEQRTAGPALPHTRSKEN
jgi:hypothetical protein